MISQIELVSAITRHLDSVGVKTMIPRQINAVIDAANLIIAQFAIPERKAEPGIGLDAWMMTDDTGVSSEFMASVLSGRFMRRYGHPHDANDFGRCVRLLEACPELRAELDVLEEASPEWYALATRWGEFESLYRDAAPDFSKRLNEAYDEARAFLENPEVNEPGSQPKEVLIWMIENAKCSPS